MLESVKCYNGAVPFLADYGSRPIEIVGGEGCFLTDATGKRYLDFIAGWCVGTLGWKRREVAEAIHTEANHGRYVPQFFRFPEQERFAEVLVRHAPGTRLTKALRCTSGSEAVELAVKCARAATGKPAIVAIDGVYHGHTYAAASVGNACTPRMAPCLPDVLKLPLPSPTQGVTGTSVVAAFADLLRKRRDIAAFLSEPLWTNAGAVIPPDDFYPAIEALCREHGVLLIMDEVATGFGRCGSLFASTLWNLSPDILCLAKGLTGGFGTMGATLISEEVFRACAKVPTYSTFGWAPLDLAAARANIDVLFRERLWENAEKVGRHLLALLQPLEGLPHVLAVRGRGLVLGIEIVRDKGSKLPDPARALALQDACAAAGLLIETAGHSHGYNVLFLTPSLVLTEALAEEGAAILARVLRSA